MAGALPALHDTGAGPSIVFLHAFPLDSSQWDHQVAALSGRYRCVRPDYWGCGASPAPQEQAPTLDAYATAVLHALDDRGIDRFHLVGSSMGGYIAFALVRQAAERLLSLVLACTRATADSDEMRASRLELADRVLLEDSVESMVEGNVQRLLGPRAREEVHVADPLRGRIRRCTPAGVAHAARAMAARPDSTSALGAITVPTLVIAGADDATVQPEEIDSLATAIPDARLVTMSCGHLANLEVPPVFTEELRRFLESLSPAAV